MTELKFENMTAAASGDRQNMLGKLLYFSLPSVLVDKDDLRQLCADSHRLVLEKLPKYVQREIKSCE